MRFRQAYSCNMYKVTFAWNVTPSHKSLFSVIEAKNRTEKLSLDPV